MAAEILPHLLSLINQQIEAQEDLSDCLSKAEALAQVAVTPGFVELSEPVIYNYLWLLSDIVIQARNLNQQSLSTLLKQRPISLC